MKHLYKYHVRLYRLYEIFGDKIFFAREADEALRSCSYIYSNSSFLMGLHRKKLIRNATRKEVTEEIEDYNFRCNYRKLTMTGLAIARLIENNKRYLTMYILRN